MKTNPICLLKTVRYKTHSFKCLLTKLAYVPSFLVDFVQVLVVNAIVRNRRVTTIRLLSHFMWSDFPPVTSAQRARVFVCGWRKGQHKWHVMGFHFGSRTAAYYCNHTSTEMHLQKDCENSIVCSRDLGSPVRVFTFLSEEALSEFGMLMGDVPFVALT